ncbi:MAG: rod shape-determining protein MreC [Eubacterium sp.]|nr:rod shape-determining protein MreC [Eubacterium sp.]
MRKKSKFQINPKILIFIITVFCVVCLLLSVTVPSFAKPVKSAVSVVVIPLQDGVNHIGTWFTERSDALKTVKELTKENRELKDKVGKLEEENSLLSQNKYELERLRQLYELDQDYSHYKKVGASVIGKDTGNWFNIFTINKGSDDGIKVDMNVICDGGLVGIVFDVGKNYAKVRSIIDDESGVSVCFTDATDTGIVSGDLKLIEKGYLNITDIPGEAKVSEGDVVVTSKISDKFLPGILVGYVNKVSQDSNELTQSGTILPVVDFEHINEVLVITEIKETVKG